MSYIEEVKKALQKHYGNIEVFVSSRKDKKLMVRNPQGKLIHFGERGASDFIQHKDAIRRKLFRTRNSKWATAEKYTPAHLSFYGLW